VSERAGEDAGTSPESIYARRRVHLVVLPFLPRPAALSPSAFFTMRMTGDREEGGTGERREEVKVCMRARVAHPLLPPPASPPPPPPGVRAYVPPPESIVFH